MAMSNFTRANEQFNRRLCMEESTRIFLAYIKYKGAMTRAGVAPDCLYTFEQYREQWLEYEVKP